jgi:CRISPR-associated protein Csc2
VQLSATELDELIADVDRHLATDDQAAFLKRLSESYEPMRKVKATSKKKGKGKEQEA